MNIKKMRKRENFVYEIDQKRKSLPTEVDAHPAICVFRVSDEDTSSVRVLLFYCLWESIRARACTPFDSLSLSFSFFPLFKCSSLSIVVCCLFTCTDRRLLRISSLFPVQFMAEKLRGDTYVCDNRSFIFLLVWKDSHIISSKFEWKRFSSKYILLIISVIEEKQKKTSKL